MRTIKIAGILFFVLFVLVQSYMIMATNRTEQQKYTVVHTEKEFEIRFYPSATFASIQSEAKTYKELASPGFRQLAGYIFGGNEANKKISMTSPVHMDVNDTTSSMSFVMPSDFDTSNLPKPNNANVKISTSEDEYVAVLRFGGYASDKDLKFYTAKLQKLLAEKGIKTYGHYRYLGYNPPYQVFGRRNEIIVSVVWKKE
ncbi:MAG: heme-binding protein [Paludibacter sp.]